MTKLEAKLKLKEMGLTLTALAEQSAYSRGFMTEVFRLDSLDAAYLPVRVFEVLRDWGIVDYRREDVLKPTDRQTSLLKSFGALPPSTMAEASALIEKLISEKRACNP